MTCSFLELLILFLKTLVQIFFIIWGLFLIILKKYCMYIQTPKKTNDEIKTKTYIAWKVSKCRVFSSPYFPVFGLNIQSEYRKIRTRKNSVFGHFSRSDIHIYLFLVLMLKDPVFYVGLKFLINIFLSFITVSDFMIIFRSSRSQELQKFLNILN